MLRAAEAAAKLGISYGTLANWRSMGLGPKFTKRGGLVLYRESDLARFMKGTLCPRCGQRLPLRLRKPRS